MRHIVEHNITMPIEQETAFDLPEIKDAVRSLTRHRTKGRLVISFQKPGSAAIAIAA